MNPVDVVRYLEGLALAGDMEDPRDRSILLAAANIVLGTVEKAIKEKGEQPDGEQGPQGGS